MLAPTTVLQDRYRIEAAIGRGGMGTVYRAADLCSGSLVAVKHLPGGDAVRRRAFAREAALLADLRHPALPEVVDHFAGDAGSFLVMAFVPGDDLGTLLLRRDEPFPPEEVLRWADRLLDALGYLHDRQPPVIHRDVKPQNLKLTADGEIVLLDFGLATAARADRVGYTLRYAPPEQIRGEAPDGRGDLYALAATLSDLLTGVAPVDAARRAAALAAGEPDPLRPIREQNPGVPPPVASVLEWALALPPEDRPASAGVMRQALRTAAVRPTVRPEGERPPTNLPPPAAPLIGRKRELASLLALLRWDNPGARRESGGFLVTLTGPGGTGKTRLALEVAAELRDDFADGVFLVELAALRDPALVETTIAQALGVRETGDESPRDRLVATLRDHRLLLVLDNCEHLPAASARIADLLVSCPGLTILATSRAPLRLPGEREYPVPPLAVPDLRYPDPTELLARTEAVALFAERARAANPDFALTEANVRDVAAVCVRLDGLPLAIELAAARTRDLAPAETLRGFLDLLPRHRSMRAAIAWSHDLLDETEQAVFRRLAVFAGGCTPEAAEAVSRAVEESRSREERDSLFDCSTPRLLDSLVDKSLLRRQEGPEAEPRFVMLETIRDDGRERLAATGELEAARAAHAAWFLTLAETAESGLTGPDQGRWLARLAADHDNLRAALNWAVEHGAAEVALRQGGALWRYWYVRGYLHEGSDWLERALGIDAPAADAARAKALHGAGVLAHNLADHPRARARYEGGLALRRALGDDLGVANTLNNLAILAYEEGDHERATAYYEECLALRRALGDRRGIAYALNGLGVVARRLGDLALAAARYEEGLALGRELGDRAAIARTLQNLGLVAAERGDHAQATARYEESLALFQDLEDSGGVALTQYNLARVARDLGDAAQAIARFQTSLEIDRELGDRLGVAECLEGLGELITAERPDQAARLLGAAVALREAIGTPRPPDDQARYEQGLAAIRDGLGETAFAAAWEAGRALAWEQAVAEALEEV